MSVLSYLPLVWSQVFLQGVPGKYKATLQWLVLFGEPSFTVPGLIGGLITWLKLVSLFCLLGWVASWLATAFRERTVARGGPLDIAALVALVGGLFTVLLRVLEVTKRVNVTQVGGVPVVTLLALLCGAVFFVWLEAALWRTIRRHGAHADLSVLIGLHLAILVGLGLAFYIQNRQASSALQPEMATTWRDALIFGVRLSATYMGFVVLARVVSLVLRELIAVRFRRLYAIASVSVIEANRRMWAPWVVITVFLVILAFTHWFLQPPRPAEMGRLFVGTLLLLCSLLLTVMITLLTPLSLPQDIQQQTIYTVVSKPVRRIELIWGRMIGFMMIVTVLVLVFGGISLGYLWRTVGAKIRETEELARNEKNPMQANALREQADQLRTRMAARVPIKGSLVFIDSKGNRHVKGIDIGADQGREPRSHIEGATPATAIWRYGIVPDPYDERLLLDRRIPVDLLLKAGTIEAFLDQVGDLEAGIKAAEQEQAKGNLPAAKASRLAAVTDRRREALVKARADYDRLAAEAKALQAKAKEQAAANQNAASDATRRQEAALHSLPIPLQMTFNVYRTTKGRIGEPVFAEMEVTNPRTGEEFRNVFPIREYYTNKQAIPASILAGSGGALTIQVRCINQTQYLGMAESDLYILAHEGDFGTNFMKGLFGVWLQAMVLTAIGVFAGTFLSWPVALLTTLFFFIAGQVAFAFLVEFSNQSLIGGGPFESMIRMLAHENQVTDLTPTLAVVTAKTLDSIVMPVMSRLVFIVPNFSALDVSNTVADGFAVSWSLLASNLLLALAYALPFSIAGYFILKNREVAA